MYRHPSRQGRGSNRPAMGKLLEKVVFPAQATLFHLLILLGIPLIGRLGQAQPLAGNRTGLAPFVTRPLDGVEIKKHLMT